MNRIVMPKHAPRLFAALCTLALLASCYSGEPPAGQESPPLEGAAIGGPFELVNGAGETVRWSDFDGRYRMVYFGYAWCPDACPFDLARMMQGYRRFAEDSPELATQVQPIFITVDPARDTPEKIAEYTANFGDELLGLTGSEEAIAEAATNFSVFYVRGPDDPNVGYMMDHSRAGYLMGRNGEPIALLPVEESADGVAAELAKWVN